MRFLALVIVLSTAVVVDVSPNQQAVVTPEAVIAQLHAGHPVRATQLADSLVEHDPRSALSHALYGLAALRSTEFPKAIAALRRAIDLDPMSAEANLGLGLIDFGRGRFADAERRFRIAAESEAFKGEAFHWLGLCLAEQRRFDEAAAASEMALPYLQYYPHVQRFNLESRVTFFRILAPLSIVDIPSEFTSTEIPITPADGLLNVDLRGNGHQLGQYALDTGFPGYITLVSRLARRLGLQEHGDVILPSLGVSVTARYAVLDSLELGELKVRNVPVLIVPDDCPIPPILGLSVLKRLNLTVDLLARKLILRNQNRMALHSEAIDSRTASEPIPFFLLPHLFVEAELNGRPAEYFIFDTGATQSVLHTEYFRTWIFPALGSDRPWSPGGSPAFLLDVLCIGDREFHGDLVITADLTEVYEAGRNYFPGIIGMSHFKRNRLHFDFRNHLLVIDGL